MWANNEDGPDCYCGNPTVVKIIPPRGAILICLFHTSAEGVYQQLPDEAPNNWDEVTIEDVRAWQD